MLATDGEVKEVRYSFLQQQNVMFYLKILNITSMQLLMLLQKSSYETSLDHMFMAKCLY